MNKDRLVKEVEESVTLRLKTDFVFFVLTIAMLLVSVLVLLVIGKDEPSMEVKCVIYGIVLVGVFLVGKIQGEGLN